MKITLTLLASLLVLGCRGQPGTDTSSSPAEDLGVTIIHTTGDQKTEEKKGTQTTTVKKVKARPASEAMRKLVEEADYEKIPTLER